MYHPVTIFSPQQNAMNEVDRRHVESCPIYMPPIQGPDDTSGHIFSIQKYISRERIKPQLSIDLKITILSTNSIWYVKKNAVAKFFRPFT